MSTPGIFSLLSDDDLLALLAEDVVDGAVSAVAALVEEALHRGLSEGAIIQRGLVAGMDVVSAGFRDGVIFVPEMAAAARAMKSGLDVVQARASVDAPASLGVAVLGTVRGDLHDLGKTMVDIALSGAGFSVVDLGVNVKPEAFVLAVAEHQPQVLCLSAGLSTSLPFVEQTITALVAAGLRERLLVIVGGTPLNDGFARLYGADVYAPDVEAAVTAARAWAARARPGSSPSQEQDT